MQLSEYSLRCYTSSFVDVSSIIWGHSKALYSTWLFYRPDHLLVDCGEGAATTLGNGGYAIERVLLTHGHIDHIAGLPPLIWSRASGMGDNEKPLQIYFPRGDHYILDMREYIHKAKARLPFELSWIEIEAGTTIPLPATENSRHARRAQTFATKHMKNGISLGYQIMETRRRLKSEYSNLAQEELRTLAQRGENLSEDYDAILCAFGGDGLPLNPNDVRNAEILFHEATLIDGSDRKHQLHSTLDEAVQVAHEAEVKTLVLHHVSGRYRKSEIETAARESMAKHQLQSDVWCLFRDRLWKIES